LQPLNDVVARFVLVALGECARLLDQRAGGRVSDQTPRAVLRCRSSREDVRLLCPLKRLARDPGVVLGWCDFTRQPIGEESPALGPNHFCDDAGIPHTVQVGGCVESAVDRSAVAATIVGVTGVERLMNVPDPVAKKEQRFGAGLVGGGRPQQIAVACNAGQDAVAVAVTVRQQMRRSRHVHEMPRVERIELVPARLLVARLLPCLVREDAPIGEEHEPGAAWGAVFAGKASDFLLPCGVEQLEGDPADDAMTFGSPGRRILCVGKGEARGDRKRTNWREGHGCLGLYEPGSSCSQVIREVT